MTRTRLCVSAIAIAVGLAAVLSAQGTLTNVQKADVNGDSIVNNTDLTTCRAAFGKREGQAGYVARCDMDGNKLINNADLSFIQRYIGQTIPPTIQAAVTPPANAAGWHNTDVTVSFTCTSATSCSSPVTVTAEGAAQAVTGTASGGGGSASTTVTLNVDKTAPAVQFVSPADNSFATVSPVAVQGTFSSGVSPVASVTCNGAAAAVTGLTFDCSVDLQTGANPITVVVTDAAGNAGTGAITVNFQATPRPTITTSLSPAPNAAGWHNTDVTVDFTCTNATSCPAPVTVTTEGANQVVQGTATGPGGTAAAQVTLNVDKTKPILTATPSPAANVNGWNNSPVVVTFSAVDALSGVDQGSLSSPVTISTEGASQTAGGDVLDIAGNRATTALLANIDLTPPVLSWTSPADGATLLSPTLTASGTVSDLLSGVSSVTCGGTPAAINLGSVECALTFAAGANAIVTIASDLAGNTATATRTVTYRRAPVITILSPAGSSYLNISPTTITGTVDDPTATVTINSIPAPNVNGSFSIPLPLAEGPNIVTATATAGGAVATSSIELTLDTTPPHVTITSPTDLFTTTEASISVAGSVNDIVVGTVNSQQAQVTVNGAAAQVANRTFLATDVPLALGPNVIQAVGRDRVGNAVTTQITVTRTALTQAQIRLVSGNNQAAAIGSLVPSPLVVEVIDAAGAPVAGKPVIFKVTQNDGLLAAGGTAAPTVIATTDAQGRASVQWTLGNRAGSGGNAAEAYSVGFEGTALFTASGTLGATGKVVVDTGNDQIGAINEPLPKPFIAVVVDSGNNRLGGVPVTFTVQQGGGSFGGQPSVTVDTDSDGRAAATLTLGLQEGNANNLVEATVPSNTGAVAAFTASGRAPGAPANTTITGVVLDNSNIPIPGVTIRAVLTNVLHSNAGSVQTAASAQTDAQGQFTISPAPIGFVKLLVDGSTAQLPGTYPSLEYDLVTVSGQTNTVGQPMYLLALNTANQLCVTPTTGGGTLTIPEAPGFSLTFGPGQVTFPGGSKTGCVSVTVVNGDKVPMVPGFGQQPRFIVTIQPAGATFNPPAPITLPNVDGLAPRAVTEMYSFDHDIGSFVAIGTGVVSEDGLVIRSSTGVGVLKAGWHCGGDPAANGTVADCPTCQSCQGNKCVPDDSNKPPEKCASCKNGTPVPPQTDAQCCATQSFAGGYVVCCNGSKLACTGSGFAGTSAGMTILRACAIQHEIEHYKHVDCPTGAAECNTTRPPFKPGQSSGDGECDAYKVEMACLQASNCGTDTACQTTIANRIVQIKTDPSTGVKPGCFP